MKETQSQGDRKEGKESIRRKSLGRATGKTMERELKRDNGDERGTMKEKMRKMQKIHYR